MRSPVLVVGIGHTLMSDDALGPRVIEALLAEGGLPEGVEAHDFGTTASELTEEIVDRDAVLVIDALSVDGSPGDIHAFELEAMASFPATRMSTHQPDVFGAWGLASILSRAPQRGTLIGAVTASTELGTEMTPAVRDAIPELVARVRAWIDEVAPAPGTTLRDAR